MDKATGHGLFVNDGSFLERFKQLQQEKGELLDKTKSGSNTHVTQISKTDVSQKTIDSKDNSSRRMIQTPSSGKLAFSLKQKSKLIATPVNFGEDLDEDKVDGRNSSDEGLIKRPKLVPLYASDQSSKQISIAPPSPSDPTVKNVADKLASFVAKNGRQFEHVTRQKNPGDTPFKFLFDETCTDYKYYEYRLSEEQKALPQSRDSQTLQSSTTIHSVAMSETKYGKYQTPASALYDATENLESPHESSQTTSRRNVVESSAPPASDPIAMMEYYMKKAEREEKQRPFKLSKDEMPPTASLQVSDKKGHHMGDYIPLEELEMFMATCNDVSAQKVAEEAAEKTKIQADNVGHRLLSKMGWKEGEGLGSSKSGMSAPIVAGGVKKDHLGVGAQAPGEVTPEDDIYEQYKKRMMLGYRHRPNPLNNPRKAYY